MTIQSRFSEKIVVAIKNLISDFNSPRSYHYKKTKYFSMQKYINVLGMTLNILAQSAGAIDYTDCISAEG